ncbi:MAG TPA: cation diffusion facilitator family transporter [Thermoanaerobaculia bacterium]|nr:cation diffusion facilitator family transporter [Thermoanaerobaculia bacterium]HQR65997.1 cation diffusion facilitator family transporter [Thermoanaerobaculia bacterium]
MAASTHPRPAAEGPGAPAFALLSIVTAVATITLKLIAWKVTGSVGLLSDAMESFVNLLAAAVAFWALTVAQRPADPEHAFGHTKAEYLAAGFEGMAILAAAVAIAAAAVDRLFHPQPLERIGLGLAFSVGASVLNLAVALVLLRASKRLHSITLRADAWHLLTDVWTSAGVLAAIALVWTTGWSVLDPVVALLVAVNIVWTGLKLLHETGHGLLDRALNEEDQRKIDDVLDGFRSRGAEFHEVRTRAAGPRQFVQMHVLVPGSWTVQQGHDLLEEVEKAVAAVLPNGSVITHLEPLEDPASWDDAGLERKAKD